MTEAILNGYYSLVKGDDSTDFAIVPPAPYLHGYTKIKRWWNQSYDKVTYTGCALISYRDAYIVVSCDVNVLLKIIANNNDELTFNVIFKNQGDGGIRRILVCPKTELHDLVNYDDYYYDYSDKQIKRVKHGSGGLGIFGSASLDLQFAANKSLVDTISGNNLITFSRLSGANYGATYVDSDGLIKTTPVNLVLYSQDFTNSFWRNALSSSTVSSPDGGQNAYELTNSNLLFQDNINSAPANATITTSIFAKYNGTGNAEGIQLRVAGIGQNAVWGNFNLVNGSVGNTSAASGTSGDGDTWTLIDYGIEPFANGWYKVHITYTCSSATRIQFRPSDSPATDVENSTGTGIVLVFGVQVEESTTASPYIKTTNNAGGAARYENGELLLEPARVNLLAYSEQFDQWNKGNGSSVTPNQSVAPDGTNTADRVQHIGSGSSWIGQLNILTIGTEYTATVYAKAVTPGTNAQFGFSIGGTVNSDTKTATSEWQRFTWTAAATTGSFYISNGDDSYDTDVYFWGAQVEAAPDPTSYIPTSGSTVTRAADVSTSALGVDSWFNKTEWTIYSEDDNYNGFNWILHDGDNAKRYGCAINEGIGINKIFERTSTVGGGNGDISVNASTNLNGFIKSAAAMGSSANLYTNGLEGNATDPFENYPLAATELAIGFRGSYLADTFINGHIKRLAYFPTRLPDTTLQTITYNT